MQVHAEETELCELGDHLAREDALLEPVADLGEDLLADELPHGVADRLLLLVEERVDREEVEGVESWAARRSWPRSEPPESKRVTGRNTIENVPEPTPRVVRRGRAPSGRLRARPRSGSRSTRSARVVGERLRRRARRDDEPSRSSRAWVVDAGELLEVVRRDDDREHRVDVARGASSAPSRSSRPGRSSPAPGSSRSSRRGRATSARAIRARLRSPCEQSPKRRSAEPAEAEGAEQRVGAVDVEHREPLLEVADRRRRSGRITSRTVSIGAKRPLSRASTNPMLAQARHVGTPHRLAEDLDRAAAREIDRAGEGQQRRLAGSVGPEQRPRSPGCTAPRDVPSRSGLRVPLACVPAPDPDIRRAGARAGVDRRRLAVYTY